MGVWTDLDGDPIPKICRSCRHFDSDYDEYMGISSWFCNKNVWWPTKKGTCKKWEGWKRKENG